VAKLDGVSKTYYADEVRDFVQAGIRRLRETNGGRDVKPERGFRIDNTRVVERKVASGHKVLYVNRGSVQA